MKPYPVRHRGRIIGAARTQAGALRVARAHLHRTDPRTEGYSATLRRGAFDDVPRWEVGTILSRTYGLAPGADLRTGQTRPLGPYDDKDHNHYRKAIR